MAGRDARPTAETADDGLESLFNPLPHLVVREGRLRVLIRFKRVIGRRLLELCECRRAWWRRGLRSAPAHLAPCRNRPATPGLSIRLRRTDAASHAFPGLP